MPTVTADGGDGLITTVQALVISLLALLPGALYLWSYERIGGAYGVRLADRLLRFFGASAVLHALMAGLTYHFYKRWIVSEALIEGHMSVWTIEVAALIYVGAPIAAGTFVAIAKRSDKRWLGWSRFIVGPAPEPRAWDYVWQLDQDAVIRMRLKSGRWLAGYFATVGSAGTKSWASGYGEDHEDLFLANQIRIDPTTGDFLYTEEGLFDRLDGIGLLVRWDDVEYFDYIV